IHAKLFENDLPNGKRVIENARPADIRIDIWE
ncbi:nucleoside/nucleotide kinase family protein, partial [Rhizobium sp. BR5]